VGKTSAGDQTVAVVKFESAEKRSADPVGHHTLDATRAVPLR
jgi:hypothetical protein